MASRLDFGMTECRDGPIIVAIVALLVDFYIASGMALALLQVFIHTLAFHTSQSCSERHGEWTKVLRSVVSSKKYIEKSEGKKSEHLFLCFFGWIFWSLS